MSETRESQGARANLPEFTVSELSAALKRTVEEAFPYVRVRGELGKVTRHASGHIYLDLKDENATIAGVVWRGSAGKLGIAPELGLEVVVTGRLTTFAGQSKYQIVIERMELAGLGALMKMLEERRKKLAAEGLFDASRKKKLPFLPEVIGVITSPTGAVIRDILHRLADRFPRRVLVWPVAVQGERAAGDVAAAIEGFNKLSLDGAVPRPDVLIVARGGGSLEDLMAFNEESVVRAAAASKIPLISAVGHETDTTLIDFAADLRAPTPTAAAEHAVPVRADLVVRILDLAKRLVLRMERGLSERKRRLADLARSLPRKDDVIALREQRLDALGHKLASGLLHTLQRGETRLARAGAKLSARPLRDMIKNGRERARELAKQAGLALSHKMMNWRRGLAEASRLIEGLSYKATLARGYALVRGAEGGIKRKAGDLRAGERLRLEFSDGSAGAVAEGAVKSKPLSGKKPGGSQGSLF